jgi:hypothetical protein
MIRVTPKSEPSDFNTQVRVPGVEFLLTCPNPTTKQWASRSYWRRILKKLHSDFSGICSYSCHWIPYDTGADTVEHFKPKNLHPRDAYEWANYRLVCQTLNSRKRIDENIVDPFVVTNGWFVIEFPSLIVKPGEGLNSTIRAQVVHTCKKLKLNDEETCILARFEWVREFCAENVNFAHLEKRAPFLAMELARQGYNSPAALRVIMKL